VYCLGLEPGTLGQPFGGGTRRRTECHRDGLREQDLQNRVDQRRLADPGAAGDHQHLRRKSDADSLDWALGERQLCPFLDPRDRLLGSDEWPRRPPDSQCPQLSGDLALGPVQPGEEHAAPALEIIGDDRAVLKLEAKGSVNELCRNLKQFARQGQQLVVRQTAVAVVHRFGERKGDAGTYADQRGLLDAELGRDLVGGAEADATDVAGQAVGVLRDQLDGNAERVLRL
jgi:hypothetical protein